MPVPKGMKLGPASAERKAKIGAASHENWKDLHYRARIIAAMREFWNRPENRARRSAALTGRPCSAETRAKISVANKGRKPSKETLAKLSAARRGRRGPLNPNWKGGRRKTPEGYIEVRVPSRPVGSRRYVQEHRLVMEASVGRSLDPRERVHHINEIKDDNRRENLQIFRSPAEHARFHRAAKAQERAAQLAGGKG